MERGFIYVLLLAFSIIPLVMLLSHWRKIVNPIIKVFYEFFTVVRKREYLPPRIFIEGFGIKRGLNDYEALLISERPFHEILGLMLKKAIEKGAVQVQSLQPLKLDADKLLPDSLSRDERDFVRICTEKNIKRKKRQEKFANLMIKIIKTVSNEMRGFSHKETVDYYIPVVDRASKKANLEGIQTMVYGLIDDVNELTKTITKAINPYKDAPFFKEEPKYMKNKSRGGSGIGRGYYGGGGGSACACAGCACACAGCACACAGGGR